MDIQALKPKIIEAAGLMEMLSQPNRLLILCQLLEGERSVQQLAQAAGLSQPAMSHHLKKLRTMQLVQTRRDAQTIFYSLRGKHVESVLTVLHELYCSEELQ